MTINPNIPAFNARSPLHQLVVSLFVVLLIGAVMFFLFTLLGRWIFAAVPGSVEYGSQDAWMTNPGFAKYTIMTQDISFFILPSVIILSKFNPGHQTSIITVKFLRLNDLILISLLALCTFPVNSFAGQLNAGMVLPDWLSGVEEWMRGKEKDAEYLLDLIMTPVTLEGMWLNLLIIAAIPAISEELIFRGVFQKIFQNLFKSGPLAVWFTSFLFSAIHFQFYGFLPRLILGLIFGYLFLWSGNLWLPVIAHFLNNAVPTVGSYIKGWESINTPSSATPGKHLAFVFISLAAGIIILAWFRRRGTGVKRESFIERSDAEPQDF